MSRRAVSRIGARRQPRLRNQLGATLRAERKAQRLSQERLGRLAGLSGKFIGEVERGEKSISTDSLYMIARVLKVDMPELVRVNGYEPTPEFMSLVATVRKMPVRMQSRVLKVAQIIAGTA